MKIKNYDVGWMLGIKISKEDVVRKNVEKVEPKPKFGTEFSWDLLAGVQYFRELLFHYKQKNLMSE